MWTKADLIKAKLMGIRLASVSTYCAECFREGKSSGTLYWIYDGRRVHAMCVTHLKQSDYWETTCPAEIFE